MTSPKYTIFTTMKNEGAFMLEWIAYNRAIGFTDFIIFTNDCDDGTDQIALRLEEMGLATHVENPRKGNQGPQRVALRKARFRDDVQAADWVLCADCDEFLNIRVGDGRLPDLFEAVGDVEAISVCWKLFGDSGQQEFKRGFVTEQFTYGAPEKRYPKYRAKGIKTLFKPTDKIRKFGVHRTKLHEEGPYPTWVDAGGHPMPERMHHQGWSAHPRFSHDFARLHHYAVRSVDSFLVKRDRGRTNHVDSDQGLDYWQAMNMNDFEDTSILPRLDAARLEYDRLLSDPKLKALHEAACLWHEAKIAELKARDGWPEFRELISNVTGFTSKQTVPEGHLA